MSNSKITSPIIDTRDFTKLNLFVVISGGNGATRDLRLKVYQRSIFYTGHNGEDLVIAETENLANGIHSIELGDVQLVTNSLKKNTISIPMILPNNIYFVVEDVSGNGGEIAINVNMELKR